MRHPPQPDGSNHHDHYANRNVLTTSYGSISYATTILVEVETDEGITGLGQASVDAPFYGETAEGMLVNIRTYLAPALIGENPLEKVT